ncbi:hypothetical protein B0H16DRAFT_1904455 [Mycena metata]|uniref:Uncharacterized protein n=1 Tax=Mycena metata TaxID=1033252 RepID=A0AAD7DKP6_9AGAR|nr:hypothetical protein B0H16DRAFT_1904455 [Mycena metata]
MDEAAYAWDWVLIRCVPISSLFFHISSAAYLFSYPAHIAAENSSLIGANNKVARVLACPFADPPDVLRTFPLVPRLSASCTPLLILIPPCSSAPLRAAKVAVAPVSISIPA